MGQPATRLAHWDRQSLWLGVAAADEAEASQGQTNQREGRGFWQAGHLARRSQTVAIAGGESARASGITGVGNARARERQRPGKRRRIKARSRHYASDKDRQCVRTAPR